MNNLTRRNLIAGAATVSVLSPFAVPRLQAAAPLAEKQNHGWYRYKVGSFEVTVVTDDLAREFARLRAAVRARDIVPDDMRGGTFTISNLGMYGVDAFTAIINPPESAILAIGRTADTPVGRGGQIVLRPMATFTLSSDHRIVDGVTAARFVADLREAIEHPEGLS